MKYLRKQGCRPAHRRPLSRCYSTLGQALSVLMIAAACALVPLSPPPAGATPTTRLNTVEFFAGQHTGTTGANQNVQVNFSSQTMTLAESSVSIKSAYVELSGQIGAATATTYASSQIYFAACTPSCSPSPTSYLTTGSLGANTGDSQYVRLRADVTADSSLAAYTGGGAARTFAVGYCFASTNCSGTTAANIFGVSAKLVVTYLYDASSTNRTSTVNYPLESSAGSVASKTASQAVCTMDSTCPKFTYNADIPEIASQYSQNFNVYAAVDEGSADVDVTPQVDGSASGTATRYKGTLNNNGGWLEYRFNGLAGYANNTSQQLEVGTAGTGAVAYALGGENSVTYSYAANAATKTKTVSYPTGELITASASTTKSSLTGSTVYMPESGVTIRKAWFRVHASAEAAATGGTLKLSTKVGSNSESAQTTYAVATDNGDSLDGYFNHLIPSSDYSALEAATGSSGVLTQLAAQWGATNPGGAVSAELMITYAYTGESTGYQVTQRVFAGQQTAVAATTYSTSTGAFRPYIPEAIGPDTVSIRGAHTLVNAKNIGTTAGEQIGSNLATGTCTATLISNTTPYIYGSRLMLWKDVTGTVSAVDTQTYTFCGATTQSSIFTGVMTVTYQVNTVAPGASWLSGWNYRKILTVDHTKVTSHVSNFPVLVKLTSSNFPFANALSTGYDIRFTSADGSTSLSFERERWNQASQLGEFWVKLPSISSNSDTKFYIYWGKAGATDAAVASSPYDASTLGVWHMNENPGTTCATSKHVCDVTSNALNMTASGSMNAADSVSGKIVNALDFDGTDDNITPGDVNAVDGIAQVTVSMWVKPKVLSDFMLGIGKWSSNTSTFGMELSGSGGGSNNDVQVCMSNGVDMCPYTTSNILAASTWGLWTMVFDGSQTGNANRLKFYFNGNQVALTFPGGTVAATTPSNSATLDIGGTSSSFIYDQTTISTTARSAAWVLAQYHSENDTLLAFGSVETANQAPGAPTLLSQTDTLGWGVFSVGAWTNETGVRATAYIDDPDASDTLQLCIEVKAVTSAFTNSEDTCGTGVAYSGSAVAAAVVRTGLTDATQYHWQVRTKDAGGLYSSWSQYGSNSDTVTAATDIGVDSTAPSTATVYDGTSAGSDVNYNTGSLSVLSANWAAFDANVSGLSKYQYSIGTTAGGTDIKSWTDNSTTTSVTATGLTLQTSQIYYFNVRAVDNAGNTSSVASSNGQYVAPTLTFSLSSTSITFANLNAANSYTDTKSFTMTTSTNAYSGYAINARMSGNMSNGAQTFPSFNGGTYAAPDDWLSGDTGLGYTTSDTLVNGANIFQPTTCLGGNAKTGNGCYAPFSTGAAQMVADHPGAITGTSIASEVFTMYLKVKSASNLAAGTYSGTILISVTATY